jgi:hypothetical protein
MKDLDKVKSEIMARYEQYKRLDVPKCPIVKQEILAVFNGAVKANPVALVRVKLNELVPVELVSESA